jgi:hypothetical protein
MLSLHPPNKLDIIYFSSVEWNYTWQRPQQIASRLSQHGHLLYISPLGLRAVQWQDAGRVVRRLAFRLTHQTIWKAEPLTVYTPLAFFPFPHNPLANRINGRALHKTIQSWMRRSNITKPIVWIGTPSLAALIAIQGLNPRLIIYDCLDNFPLFHSNPLGIIEAEQQIVAQAQLVFASASELLERMKTMNPHTFLLPNAVDYAHFAPIPSPECPTDLLPVRHPILGYVGEMAHWFDFDLVTRVAAEHPEWTIVLIGPLHQDARRAAHIPNVKFLGRKNYSDLPKYVSQFDVCLLPFKINALTSAVSPIKLYEYLAAGKPVVSTPLREVIPLHGVVEIASRIDFATAIQRALETGAHQDKIEERLAVARQNTWDDRVQEILRLIQLHSKPL